MFRVAVLTLPFVAAKVSAAGAPTTSRSAERLGCETKQLLEIVVRVAPASAANPWPNPTHNSVVKFDRSASEHIGYSIFSKTRVATTVFEGSRT